MRVTFDPVADAVYIYLREIERGGAVKTITVDEALINLDFDKEGRLIGIEVLQATDTLPDEVLKRAERV
ncbi:MAG TPA: DUF2283 domain-containing protein [Chloroflexota bacterium]